MVDAKKVKKTKKRVGGVGAKNTNTKNVGIEKKKQMGVLGLIVALMVVLIGGVLFVGAVSGWFGDSKVVLSEEYYGEFGDFMDLTGEEYEKLVKEEKSFVVFVDQEGCTTADRLGGFVTDWANEVKIKV